MAGSLGSCHPVGMLSACEVESFVADGYAAIRAPVPADVVRPCQRMIWSDLGSHGVTEDPATWTEPVARIACPEGGPFAEAGTRPALWEAFDQLIGAGRWWRRPGVGGTIPVRFPSLADPGDAGWHIEASYEREGRQQVNVHSRSRGLLVLYLFSDVDEASAPTRIRPGSHLDAARVLAPAGDEGLAWTDAPAGAAQARPHPADRAGHRGGGRRLPLPSVPGPRRLLAAPGPGSPPDGAAGRGPARPVPADPPAQPGRAGNTQRHRDTYIT